MNYLAKEHQSEIITQYASNLSLALVDITEIKRVITNLVSNAIKHTVKGTKIIITTEQKDDFVQVTINDNGGGLPKEEQQYIFERYPAKKKKITTRIGIISF